MAWHRPGDKPLSEPMMVSLLTHICVTGPQWVNEVFTGVGICNGSIIPWCTCDFIVVIDYLTRNFGLSFNLDSTKLLPEPVFNNRQCGPMKITWMQLHKESSITKMGLKIVYVNLYSNLPGANELRNSVWCKMHGLPVCNMHDMHAHTITNVLTSIPQSTSLHLVWPLDKQSFCTNISGVSLYWS